MLSSRVLREKDRPDNNNNDSNTNNRGAHDNDGGNGDGVEHRIIIGDATNFLSLSNDHTIEGHHNVHGGGDLYCESQNRVGGHDFGGSGYSESSVAGVTDGYFNCYRCSSSIQMVFNPDREGYELRDESGR